MYCESAPLRCAGVEVAIFSVKISCTNRLWSESIKQSDFGAGRYTHYTRNTQRWSVIRLSYGHTAWTSQQQIMLELLQQVPYSATSTAFLENSLQPHTWEYLLPESNIQLYLSSDEVTK